MGYRAHVFKKRIVEYYNKEYFNYCPDKLSEFLQEVHYEMEEAGFYKETTPFVFIDEDYNSHAEWEIDKTWLTKAVEWLSNEDADAIAFDEYTIGEVIDAFETWINVTDDNGDFTYPDTIYVEWW